MLRNVKNFFPNQKKINEIKVRFLSYNLYLCVTKYQIFFIMTLNLEILNFVYPFITCLIITYVSIPAIIKVSRIKKLYDEPDERRVHKVVTPTLGGVAIFAGISISSLLFIEATEFSQFKFYLAGMVILFFTGIKDDILIISARKKLILQLIAATIVVVCTDVRITNFHGFYGIHEIPEFIGIPVSVFLILTIINAFNFIDGIDGYSASIAIIISCAFGSWFFLVGENALVVLALTVIAALISFLRYNLFSSQNKIFMGDTGTLILGFIIAIFAIRFNEINLVLDKSAYFYILPAPAVTFGILLVPLFDLLRIVFIRMVIGKPIFMPDKRHLHHVLLELGLSHKKIVAIMALVNIFFVIISFTLHEYFTIRRLILLLLLTATVLAYVPRIIISRKKKK